MEFRSCLVFCLSFLCTAFQKINGTGLCSTPNNADLIICCSGYMLVEDKCKECEPGFRGVNCSLTCPPFYYGLQCNEKCHCSPGMHCDSIIGCMCNTTSVNCTDPEQELTTLTKQELTSLTEQELTTVNATNVPAYQSNRYNIVPSLVFALAVLIICIICIRMLYAKIMRKRKELHSTQKVSTADNPALCLGLNSDALPQHNKGNNNISRQPLSTVSQRVEEERANNCIHDLNGGTIHNISTVNHSENSKQKQRGKGCRNGLFELPKLVEHAASRKGKQSNVQVSLSTTHDDQLYANQVDLTFTNKSFRPDCQINKYDSRVHWLKLSTTFK